MPKPRFVRDRGHGEDAIADLITGSGKQTIPRTWGCCCCRNHGLLLRAGNPADAGNASAALSVPPGLNWKSRECGECSQTGAFLRTERSAPSGNFAAPGPVSVPDISPDRQILPYVGVPLCRRHLFPCREPRPRLEVYPVSVRTIPQRDGLSTPLPGTAPAPGNALQRNF